MTDQANSPAQGEQGANASNDTQPTPKYVTEETLNRAITARLRDFEKKNQSFIGEAFGGFKTELPNLLKEFLPSSTREESVPQKPQESPEMKGLMKKLQEMESKLQMAESEKAKERAAAADMKLRSTLSGALGDAGISGVRQKAAIAMLVSEGRVKYDDSGDLVFADRDGDIDFETGIGSWLKSDDAKEFLPPRNVVGSGGSPARKPSTTTNQQSDPWVQLASVLGFPVDK